MWNKVNMTRFTSCDRRLTSEDILIDDMCKVGDCGFGMQDSIECARGGRGLFGTLVNEGSSFCESRTGLQDQVMQVAGAKCGDARKAKHPF